MKKIYNENTLSYIGNHILIVTYEEIDGPSIEIDNVIYGTHPCTYLDDVDGEEKEGLVIKEDKCLKKNY